MEQNHDDVVSLIVDLLNYKSNILEMLGRLYCGGFVTSEERWLVEQLKEHITEL